MFCGGTFSTVFVQQIISVGLRQKLTKPSKEFDRRAKLSYLKPIFDYLVTFLSLEIARSPMTQYVLRARNEIHNGYCNDVSKKMKENILTNFKFCR